MTLTTEETFAEAAEAPGGEPRADLFESAK